MGSSCQGTQQTSTNVIEVETLPAQRPVPVNPEEYPEQITNLEMKLELAIDTIDKMGSAFEKLQEQLKELQAKIAEKNQKQNEATRSQDIADVKIFTFHEKEEDVSDQQQNSGAMITAFSQDSKKQV